MKTLYIVRHAKSSWEQPSIGDHERPVLEKGVKRTKMVAKFLIEKKTRPDLIVSSDARRAYQTAVILAKKLGYPTEKISLSKMMYHAASQDVADIFYEIPENVNSLMLVGHNPTMTDFANQFLIEKTDWLPTSGVVSVSFDAAEWNKIFEVKPVVNFVVYPKMLK